ncbi:MAG: glycine cleavage system protein GcvH [Cyclobacteriaceae bacterium]|jgi:glycine cleavage system H protein|nr:glycine cleavage system protein GcvH [Cyclobacteriaceae bacterium]
MNALEKLRYTKEHAWILPDGETGKIGITDFAQSELGDIIYVDLPRIGQSFKQNEIFGSVEAVKTVSDLFMPVAGEVMEINPTLKDTPTLVNTSPFEEGWMIKIKMTDSGELNNLQSAAEYNGNLGK